MSGTFAGDLEWVAMATFPDHNLEVVNISVDCSILKDRMRLRQHG